ncbi:MAG: peptide chain release factor N(5)-glutamine methyltransferase [Alphaproteobacteria bacterium]|nr:peptide chain release factor N(5)-glutamine methyltransferase [Alphaproteobacteria bacterium]
MSLSRLELDWLKQEAKDETELKNFIQRANVGEPIAKIIGHKGFWKGDFIVSEDVLDPRPDSETLIEAVLATFPNKNMPLRFLDLGTGSGCLIISLLQEYPNAHGVAIDVSQKALSIARQNAQDLPIDFIQADMRDLPKKLGKFDVVISNPPYIPHQDIETLDVAVKNYDPILALDGGEDGLDFYRALSQLTLTKNLFAEIGQGQEQSIIDIMQKQNWTYQKSWKDLGGITRVLYFKN